MDQEERLASAVLNTIRIHEESYDTVAADLATRGQSRLCIDYEQFYTKTLPEATKEAIDEVGLDSRMILPIYLLVKLAWNDIQVWAEGILPQKEVTTDGT